MREIKFRLWSNKDKCWCDAFSIHMSGLIRTGDSEPIWHTAEEENEVLMQYTGLKDKNGKPIYESDLVKDQENNIWEVYFDMGQFLLKNKVLLNMPISLYEEPIKEVIGNIYEG